MAAEELKALAKPIDWDELYPGKFLKSGELKGRKFTLTIKAVDAYEIDGEVRGGISFKETPKLIALNKINGLCLRAMFGRKVQEWVGKRVTIYPDVVKEAGKMQGEPCIRCWGSPDIAHDLDVSIELRRRRPYTMTMHKVTKANASGAATEGRPREPGDE